MNEDFFKNLLGFSGLKSFTEPSQPQLYNGLLGLSYGIDKQLFSGMKTNQMLQNHTSLLNSSYQQSDLFSFLISPASKTKSMMDLLNMSATTFNHINNIAFGGNTISSLAKYAQTNIRKNNFVNFETFDKIYQTVKGNLSTYDRQVKISEKLSMSFYTSVGVKPNNSNIYNSLNFANQNKLNEFDFASGSTFSRTFNNFNGNTTTIESIYTKIEALIQDTDEIKEAFNKFQATALTILEGNRHKINSENWFKIKGIEYYAEWFLNKILIKKFGLDSLTAYLIISLLLISLFFTTEVLFEAKGKEFYDFVMGTKQEETKNVTNYTIIQLPNEIIDFTVRESKIYLRSSVKTKYLGYFKSNTNVEIIITKKGWCYVEGDGYKFKKMSIKKNNYHLSSPIKIRGWIKKSDLDMFQ